MNFLFEYLLKDNHYMSIIGIFVFLIIAFVFSKKKKHVNFLRTIIALAMQFAIAFLILNTNLGQKIFYAIADGFNKINVFADEGIKFVFGNLAIPSQSWGYIFAIKVLPIIIFFGALTAILYHFGIIQIFVRGINIILSPILGTSGAETLCTAANSMLDPSAATLLIKHELKNLTDSEMFTILVAAMSTITASLIAVYGSLGVSMLHLLTASVMSIPGAILISKILFPETEKPKTAAGNKIVLEKDSANILDAISSGTSTGLNIAFAVGAMLIVFIGLISMLNFGVEKITGYFFAQPYSFNQILGSAFSGVSYLIGIAKQDAVNAGALLGQKIALNEFVAYANMLKTNLNPRSITILTYAICGFANFSVIGILIGAIGSLVPTRRDFITKYGLKILLAGTLVNLLNAAIASLLI
ncbi:MAG: Nucleoside permease NupC [candidate division TM6 bacterium GW2011_GWF2_28_16]|nr:MAG: Nucleoside permease NupC [candidate division TM6 bacterium GW2011_GWF2_28_16]